MLYKLKAIDCYLTLTNGVFKLAIGFQVKRSKVT